MRERYIVPEIEVVNLSSEDLVRTSNENELPFEPAQVDVDF